MTSKGRSSVYSREEDDSSSSSSFLLALVLLLLLRLLFLVSIAALAFLHFLILVAPVQKDDDEVIPRNVVRIIIVGTFSLLLLPLYKKEREREGDRKRDHTRSTDRISKKRREA
tara:strand:+ start:529 stop:870 length:342 start_codon:yes stop_codon:yes gene_type:complete